MSGDVKAALAEIQDLNLDGMRKVWSERIGEPPPIRSTDIFRRALADRLQSGGSADAELERTLRTLASRHRAGRKPKVPTANYKPGSTLSRDWNGRRYQVEVVAGGYVWEGVKHASLSKVATLITGTRWNGPRFFGLREGAAS